MSTIPNEYPFKTFVNLFLNNSANLRVSILVPSLDYYNMNNTDDMKI